MSIWKIRMSTLNRRETNAWGREENVYKDDRKKMGEDKSRRNNINSIGNGRKSMQE